MVGRLSNASTGPAMLSKMYKWATKNLAGVCPVYKPKGILWKDLEDMIKITLEFELDWNLGTLGVQPLIYPRVRQSHEGLTNVFFGQVGRNLQNIKHANIGVEVNCQLGSRSEIFGYRKSFCDDDTEMAVCDSDDEPFEVLTETDTSNEVTRNVSGRREISSITQEELEKVALSYIGEFEQVRAPLDPLIRTIITVKNEPWNRFGDYKVHKPVRSANKFYEGQQPYIVRVNWMSRPKLIDDKFSFKVNFNNKMCIDKLVDDIGTKLGTNAKIVDCKYTSFGDLITVDDAVKYHELHLDDIVDKVHKNRLSYNFILKSCDEVGRAQGLIFRSPW